MALTALCYVNGPDTSIDGKQWDTLLRESKGKGLFQTSAPRIHGKEMFEVVWNSAVHILNSTLLIATDSKLLGKILQVSAI
jgi:hypothetical protein